MGKKYIIELEDKPVCVFDEDTQTFFPRLHRVKGFNSLVFDQNGLDKLTPYTEPDLEQVRKEAYEKGWKEAEDHYEKGYNDGYDTGLEDAWEAARKIIRMPEGDLLELFDVYSSVCTPVQVMLKYDASEAIEKIRQYEQKQEEQIQVGDEVISEDDIKAVVIDMDNYLLHVLDQNGVIQGWPREDVVKTDRHFPDIATVLKKMKEVQK